jgi:hypothetical protein
MHINYSKTCAMYGDRNLVPIKKNLANDNFILHRAKNSAKPSGTDLTCDYFGDKPDNSPSKRIQSNTFTVKNTPTTRSYVSAIGSHSTSKIRAPQIHSKEIQADFQILSSLDKVGLVRIGEETPDGEDALESKEFVG